MLVLKETAISETMRKINILLYITPLELNLSFYKKHKLFSVDGSHFKSIIMTVNIYENKLLLKTQMGLYEFSLSRGY